VFDHVTIRASDRESSERFYETALGTLRIAKSHSGEHFAAWGGAQCFAELLNRAEDDPGATEMHGSESRR
jgi:catechol 2,3-dioxygenase-like lactoylglutathione lyase family enzyme